ncbi:GTPase ObgE [Chloroflexota bacterium]
MIDKAEIRVKAGNGGNGSISFHREKFVPFGGPDGGDGGRGGSVIIRADEAIDNLRKYKQKRYYKAEDGGNGSNSKKHGKNREDTVLTVPVGTLVTLRTEDGEEAFLADLGRVGDDVVVAMGGRGGRGNTHYTSSTNQAPRIAQRGETGVESSVLLEMRLIADVGIIGYPNAGKSTLISRASAAKPKIDSYPFTTIEPVLGVVEIGEKSLVMAEIPGLIEDAHLGKGLGHDFLRHIMRTKILIHLVSGTSESSVEDMVRVNAELALFDPILAQKPQVVAVNKIDLPEVQIRLTEIKNTLCGAGIPAHYISAETGEGVSELMSETMRVLEEVNIKEKSTALPRMVYRPKPKDAGMTVSKVGEVYILEAPELERIMSGGGASPGELRWHLNSQVTRLGLKKTLEKAGIKPGDKIRCGSLEWEW